MYDCKVIRLTLAALAGTLLLLATMPAEADQTFWTLTTAHVPPPAPTAAPIGISAYYDASGYGYGSGGGGGCGYGSMQSGFNGSHSGFHSGNFGAQYGFGGFQNSRGGAQYGFGGFQSGGSTRGGFSHSNGHGGSYCGGGHNRPKPFPSPLPPNRYPLKTVPNRPFMAMQKQPMHH